jgi:hypothetical protein
MTQFDEFYKALNGNNPYKPKPTPASGLAKALFGAQQQPLNRGFLPLVKAQPKPFVRFAKPRVFVSFDFENDVHYKRLLEAWSANSRFQFIFQDMTPQEIQSDSVARVKAVLTAKVKTATHTLVIIGQYANQLHANSQLIGCRNWINFEIQQSILNSKKIVGVRIQPQYVLPEKILGSEGKHVEGFTEAGIMKALAEV